MRALRVYRFGDPSTSSPENIDVSAISENEVLIEKGVAAINPMDWQAKSRTLLPYFNYQLSLALSWDVAGLAAAAGSAPSPL
jgi:NADPH:quinone reductase-like Zn-dependent oxidoreductase